MSYEEIVHDTLLDNYGVFAFNGSKTGNAYADFLLGLPATMSQDAPVRKLDNGAYYSVFAQDDYRVHSRVTLNLGLRYDVQMPLTDPFDRKLAFVPGARSTVSPTAPEGLLFPGDPGIGRGIVKTDFNNIAPRLGLAWDVMGDGRTSVRAAGGVFYGSITGNEWNTTADNQPFTVRQSIPTVFTLSDPYRNLPGGVGPFPFEYNPSSPRFTYPAQVFGPSLDFVWPKTYQANVTVERQVMRDLSVTASYVMALGRNLPASIDRNYPVFGPGATAANVNSRRPYQPGVIGAARVLESIFASDYHALQMSAERRGARFSAKAYYTFGRAEEDLDYQGGGLPAVQNSNKIDLERGRTSADRTHSLTFSGIYNVDHFGNSSPVVKALFNDWTAVGDRHAAERHAVDDHLRARSQLRRPDQRSRRHQRRSEARQRPAARRIDRAVVQYRRVLATGDRRRRQLAAQHCRRPRLSQRRSRRVPRDRPGRADAPPGALRGHQRVQHRQPVEPGREPERARDLRQDSIGPRHAEDSARRARFVLVARLRRRWRRRRMR